MPQAHRPASLQTAAQLRPRLLAALRAWHQAGAAAGPLAGWLLVSQAAAGAGDGGPAHQKRALNEVLLAGLEELAAADPLAAQVLRARYLDGQLTKEVANRLNASVDRINRLQRSALGQLAGILLRREQAARDALAQELEASLPPAPYHRLFGFGPQLKTLEAQLLKPEAPWLVTISGLGGSGKTALADAAARRVIRAFHFRRVVWVRLSPGAAETPPAAAFDQLLQALAGQLWPDDPAPTLSGRLPRLRQALKAQPHLIVIDNLESDAHAAFLLENLAALAGPSKFLLTTRHRATAAQAYGLSPDELRLEDAAALIRDQAAMAGLADPAAISAADVRGIFQVTGGNPLALKLVVSLAAVQPLADILADLEQARGQAAEGLFRHIYWRAWRSLTAEARALLQAMPLVAEVGAAPAQLRAISRLTEAQLWPAITELWSRSLLEVRGALREKRYGIHRLTETFLRTEIIHWPEAGEPR